MRIFLVDDHILFREGLAGLLERQQDFQIVGQAGTLSGAVKKIFAIKPEVVLLDIGLPDGNGLDAIKMILSCLPDTHIVVLTIHESESFLFDAIRYGAKGYLLKNTPVNKLVAALRALERGEAALSRTMTSQILDEFSRSDRIRDKKVDGLGVLTSREMQVLQFLGTGATNREIAVNLFITENTVKIHVHNILDKLRLKNRHEAGSFARRHGLANPNIS